MSELRTDFKDDVLDVTQNEKRKYRVIHNEDGTISLEDATVYVQKGDNFGANELNEMNEVTNQMLGVNEKLDGFTAHTNTSVSSEEGPHGIRYYNEKLEVQNDSGEWNDAIEPIYAVNQKYEEGDSWVSATALPYDAYCSDAVVYNDEIHLMGGYASTAQTSHYKWNGSTWTSVTTLPVAKSIVKAVQNGNYIHAFLGNIEHYRYYSSTNTWTKLTNPPNSIYGDACLYNNLIHILGANGNYAGFYKWTGTAWTSINTSSGYLNDCVATEFKGKLHVFGNSYSGDYQKHLIWDGSKWKALTSTASVHYNGNAIVSGDYIYLIGGESQADITKIDEANNELSDRTGATLSYNGSTFQVENTPVVQYRGEIHILGTYTGSSAPYVSRNHRFKKNGNFISGYVKKNAKIYEPREQAYAYTNLSKQGNGIFKATNDGYVEIAVN